MDTLKQDCFDGLKEKHSIPLNHQNDVVMEALRVNVFDFDCCNYMLDKMRKYLRISPSLHDGHLFLYSVVKTSSSKLSPYLDTFLHGQCHVDNYVLSRKDRTRHTAVVLLSMYDPTYRNAAVMT